MLEINREGEGCRGTEGDAADYKGVVAPEPRLWSLNTLSH